MPSTPSPRLRAELQALGENLNTWGDGRLNAALTRLEEAIADVVPIAITGTAHVLTSTNYVADEARGAALVITGTLTGNTTVTAPTVEKLYLIDNRTTQGAYSLTIKTAAGTGYTLRPGPQWVFCDGSDFARGGPRLDQMPPPTSSVDMNVQRLTNLAMPTDGTDAATKAYADAQAASVAGYASAAANSASSASTSATTSTNGATTATTQAAIAVAAANTAAGIVQHVQPSEIAGIDPILDFPFRAATAVPSGVITGSSVKYVFDRAGLLTSVAAGTAPIDFEPTTSVLRGLRVEEARTNLILASDAPSTQSVSVTAQAYTLSFYGTGTITLSGAHSATVAGTGAFPNQRTLTFTPAAGTLTLTVSGAVQYAQLEAGAFATSYIRTVGSTVTRSADINTLSLASVPGWNASEGTLYVEYSVLPGLGSAVSAAVELNDGTANSRVLIYQTAVAQWQIAVGGSAVVGTNTGAIDATTTVKRAISWKVGAAAFTMNGAAATTATPASIPALTTLRLGRTADGVALNGWLRRVTLFPRYLPPTTLQLLTA